MAARHTQRAPRARGERGCVCLCVRARGWRRRCASSAPADPGGGLRAGEVVVDHSFFVKVSQCFRINHRNKSQVKFSWTMGMILYELLFPRPPEAPALLPLFVACFVAATALLVVALVSAHCVARSAAASYRRLAQQALAAAEGVEEGREGEGGAEGGVGVGGGFRFSNQRGDDGWEWGEGGEGVGRLEEAEEEEEEGPLEALRHVLLEHSLLERIPSIARTPSVTRAASAPQTPAHGPAVPPRPTPALAAAPEGERRRRSDGQEVRRARGRSSGSVSAGRGGGDGVARLPCGMRGSALYTGACRTMFMMGGAAGWLLARGKFEALCGRWVAEPRSLEAAGARRRRARSGGRRRTRRGGGARGMGGYGTRGRGGAAWCARGGG